MLPIKLTIQGFNSYQSEQVVEFNTLLESRIFGIFGEVGSGKSSILEAITYALYGQIEKMNKSDQINYNLMNLRSNKFLIDFEFKSENEIKYRFIVEGRRNSKNFNNVNIKKKKYQWRDKEWIPDDSLNAEEILGLSYQNFKRTIIIPQGKFMDFIQLKDAERTKMLKDIFNLQKFDLLDKVGHLQKKNNEDIANLEGKLSQLVNVTQENLTESNAQLKKSLTARIEKNNNLKLKDAAYLQLKEIKNKVEELSLKNKEFEILISQKKDIEQKETELQQYEKCLILFKPILDNTTSLENKIQSLEKSLKSSVTDYKSLTNLLKENKLKFAVAKKDFDNIDRFKKEREELNNILEIKNIENKISNISVGLKKSKQKLDAANSNKKKIEEQIKTLSIDIKSLEEKIPDLSLLSEIKEWFVKIDLIKNSLIELKNNLIIRENELNKLILKKEKIINQTDNAILKINTDNDLNSIIHDIENKITKYNNGLKSLQNKKNKLLIKDQLKEYSKSLEEGNPCPVCGSKHHPNPLQVEHLENELSQIEQRIEKGEKIIDTLRNYYNSFTKLKIQTENEQKNVNLDSAKLREKENELKSFTKSFKWNEYTPESLKQIEAEIKIGNALNEKLKNFRIDSQKLQVKAKTIQEELDAARNSHTKHEDEMSSLLAMQNMRLNQLKEIKYADYIDKSMESISTLSQDLDLKIKTIESDYKNLDKEIKELEIKEKVLETKIDSGNELLTELKNDLKTETNKLINALQTQKFESIELVKSILNNPIDVSATKEDIERFKVIYKTTKNEIEKLNSILQGKKFDSNKFNSLVSEIEKIKSEIEEIDNEIGSLKNLVTQLVEKLKIKQNFQKELNSKLIKQEDLKTMRSLFTGNGFVNYISTVRLQEVINYANSRFINLTRNRMKLELSENNSFNVIDFLNGGKRRSIKTLSGGQTFQASLSLALALASIVQQQNKSDQNFFFLDEGFGTQDDESLRLVFNAIKSLRKENRIIGLISHVAELKEEINTYLEVINDNEKGSLISNSWER